MGCEDAGRGPRRGAVELMQTPEEFAETLVDDTDMRSHPARAYDVVADLVQRDRAAIRAQARAELLRELAEEEHAEGWRVARLYRQKLLQSCTETDLETYRSAYTESVWREHELRARAAKETTP